MNDKIRALQKNCTDWHAEASGCLDKADPSGEERTKGLALIEKIKAAKTDIANEFKLISSRDELTSMKADLHDPETPFQFSGKAPGSGGTFLGTKDAGQIVIDSFGTVLEDVGAGVFQTEAKYRNIQSNEYKRGFRMLLRNKGSMRGIHGSELKAIQEGLDDQGGAWIPADTLMKIVARKPTPTRVAGMCTNITTGRDRVVMPRLNYSADDLYSTAFRATFTGEIPNSDTQEDVDTTSLSGNVEIPIFTAMLSAPVTNDMVEDSAFPIMPWVEDQLRIVVDLLKDNMVLNGTGTGQPNGMMNNVGGVGQPTVIKTGTTAKCFGDDLVNSAMSIPEQYDENTSWVFNKTNTANNIRKVKDSGGRYLFNMGNQDSGLVPGRPKELIGYPFAYSGFMPNMCPTGSIANTDGSVIATTGANFAIVGDLLGYYLANRLGITLQVLRETKAKRNQIELLARVRFGGKTVEPWRLRILQGK
jgi:HK97 family phage major capsid protein